MKKVNTKDRGRSRAKESLLDLANAFGNKKHKPQRKFYNRKKASDVWASLETPQGARKVRMPKADKLRGKLLAKDNFGEAMAKKKLRYMGAKFEREYPVRASGKLFFIDFFVKSVPLDGKQVAVNVALEVDGSIHNEEHVKEKDAVKDKALMALKFVNGILRVTVPKMARITVKDLHAALLGCTGLQRLEYRSQPTCTAASCTYPACQCE